MIVLTLAKKTTTILGKEKQLNTMTLCKLYELVERNVTSIAKWVIDLKSRFHLGSTKCFEKWKFHLLTFPRITTYFHVDEIFRYRHVHWSSRSFGSRLEFQLCKNASRIIIILCYLYIFHVILISIDYKQTSNFTIEGDTFLRKEVLMFAELL